MRLGTRRPIRTREFGFALAFALTSVAAGRASGATAVAEAASAAAPAWPRTETLRADRGAARANALREAAAEATALRAAPASLGERAKDARFRLPLSIALVRAGKLASARHQWRSILRRIPAAFSGAVAYGAAQRTASRALGDRDLPEPGPCASLAGTNDRGSAIASPEPYAAGLALASAGDDLRARRDLEAYLTRAGPSAAAAGCALSLDAALAARDGALAVARDRWFASLARPLAPGQRSIDAVRYAALAALVDTMR